MKSSRTGGFSKKYVLNRPPPPSPAHVWFFSGISQQENTCARASFLIKLQALLKKRLLHRFFLVIFVKFPWTTFLTKHLWATASESWAHLLPYQNIYIGSFKKTSVASKERKRKRAEKLADFISCKWKSIYLFMRQVIRQANTGLQLAYHI